MKETKRVIVTGGAGYIGSHTTLELFQHGYTPIILDNFANANPDIIPKLEELCKDKLQCIPMDVCDISALSTAFKALSPLYGIIHFAADKSVYESVNHPLKYYDNNIRSLISVLTLTKEFNIPHFVYSSSCTVYGSSSVQPVTEELPYNLETSPYGRTKIFGELIIEDFAPIVPTTTFTILRYFNPIGNHPSGLIGDEPTGVPNNLLPYLLRVASGEYDELTVFGNDYDTPDGTCQRDFIHVMDLARAHVAALEHTIQKNNNIRIYNVGTGKPHSVLELVHTFETVTGKKIKYKVGPRRPGDAVKIWAECDRIKYEIKWEARLSLEQALRDAWEFEQKRKARSKSNDRG